MRIPALRSPPLLAIGVAAACGGKQPAPAGPTGPTGGEAPAGKERPIGTSGLPGLDWGANVGEITALYPDAEPVDVGLQWKGGAERKPAVTVFTVDGDGLAQVDITWDLAFDSMSSCGEALHQTRPLIDARLGTGAEENLAVFWENDTVSVTLSCNPDDTDGARLTQTYQRKVAP